MYKTITITQGSEMALGIRGYNPVWSLFNLQGRLFDDTYYMFVLENTIPYIPVTIYNDPELNVPIANPVRFLANGTLPVDIFFVPGIYRLEFRKGPTQSDPLMYEVNNYDPSNGDPTPVDTVTFASSNQITNPQFSLINFISPLSLVGATNPDPINVAPGWALELTGTGSVTLERVVLNNSNTNPSNAPYALRITVSGWNDGGVFLRQRFQQNGMLWANMVVSSTITTRLQGAPQAISATLVDSNGSTLTQVLSVPVVNEDFNQYTGHGTLPGTTNPNPPPTAYIDYKLALPSNIDIYVTSFQLVVQSDPVEPIFEQDSINRQIDHTYNTAYPINPVGVTIEYNGFGVPLHYLQENGAAISRRIYALLFSALTTTETVTLTSGLATFTVISSDEYNPGMHLEGTGIQAGTTILTVAGTTITMSLPANASGPSLVRFFRFGNGDGSTTYNLPNSIDYVTAGSGSFGVGQKLGSATATLVSGNLPAHSHTYLKGTIIAFTPGSSTTATINTFTDIPTQTTGGPTNPPTAFSILQPTIFRKLCIRYE